MTNTKEPMAKQIDYTVADNAFEWMRKNPEEVDKYDDGGPGMEFSYAGGYGFWCNKACADRKDKEAATKAATLKAITKPDTTTPQLLAALNATQPAPVAKKSATPKKSNTALIAIGIVVAMAVLGGGAYMLLKKKK